MIEDRLTLSFQIAERLRDARSCAKLTQVQLAERTDGQVSAAMISGYEGSQRRIGIEEARVLAKALGTVTPAYLLCVEESMPLAPDETALLDMYRAADARGRALIREKAAAVS
jgi:transcriptional regulator with XRE-family HTH domain